MPTPVSCRMSNPRLNPQTCTSTRFRDVEMPAQTHPAQSPSFVEMGIGAFEMFAALAQQPLPAAAPNPPAIGIHRLARSRFAFTSCVARDSGSEM